MKGTKSPEDFIDVLPCLYMWLCDQAFRDYDIFFYFTYRDKSLILMARGERPFTSYSRPVKKHMLVK